MLEGIVREFPDLEIRALLRSVSAEFTGRYAAVKIVKGTFDDSSIIEKEAQEADIVIRTCIACDQDSLLHNNQLTINRYWRYRPRWFSQCNSLRDVQK